ncbi:MAG: nucleoside hydrolase [Bacteroidales bacterium]|nr:nucleoside hydrolase [Bacteroidales bacterium]
MKKLLPIFAILILIAGCSRASFPEKLIFDTDFGGDADDLGALTMLHNLMDRGECELLAVMCWSVEASAVPAIDALNRYYEHPGIPIGVRKEGVLSDDWNYSKPIADRFDHELNYEEAHDAADLYRRILAESEDNSVIIVTVGPLKNIQNLIKSKADASSPLSGKELIEKKVKEFVIMGGQFPEGENEWNFNGNMPGVTRFVLQNLAVPVTFSGFEVGIQIKTGAVFNRIEPNTPLYVGFKHFSEHAPWIKENYQGMILDNSSYDQTGVLYAVRRGVGIYWDRIEGGYCDANEKGGNRWIETEESNHSYLKLTMDPEEMARLIESIMLNTF